MIIFKAENEDLPKRSICSASVDLIQDSQHTVSLYAAASPNVVLALTATLGNILILIALIYRGDLTLHPQSKLLFKCLATTDLGVGA